MFEHMRRKQAKWWIEQSSYLFKPTGKNVKTLVVSPELLEDYGSRYIAVEFSYQKGRVCHILGHFWQEQGNMAGAVAMHQMIIDFILERRGRPE